VSPANDDRFGNGTTLVSPANDDKFGNGITLVSLGVKMLRLDWNLTNQKKEIQSQVEFCSD